MYGDERDAERARLLRELWALAVAEPAVKVRAPSDVAAALIDWAEYEQETFGVVTLNGAHEIIGVHAVTRGLVNRTVVHPREVFRPALADNATAVVIAHNHPSGSTEPSAEDHEVTRRLVEAGKLIGIPVLDHVIISRRGYYSWAERGDL